MASSVLRAAARLVLQLPYRSSVTDIMHRQLHWLDIQSRVRFKIGLLLYKCLHGLAPQYLSDYCVSVPISSTRLTLRSARLQERLLIVPRTRTRTIGPCGFFQARPILELTSWRPARPWTFHWQFQEQIENFPFFSNLKFGFFLDFGFTV